MPNDHNNKMEQSNAHFRISFSLINTKKVRNSTARERRLQTWIKINLLSNLK